MSSLYKQPPIIIRPSHERFSWYRNIKWRGRTVTDRQGVAGQRKETSGIRESLRQKSFYPGRDWWKKKRKEKNSKALLGCRWNFWASFTHSAKVNYRSIPLLPHLPHNFLSPTDPLSFSETGTRSLCSLHHHSKRAAQYLRL